jgi:flagellin
MPSLNPSQSSLVLASGLGRLQAQSDAATARVSSGRRIDRPAADVAGAGMAAKLDAQQARLRGVQVNLQNGVSRMQVTFGQLDAVGKIVSRMSEIGALNANTTQDAVSRGLYQVEFTQLQDQLRQMIGGTTAQIGGPADVEPSATFNRTPLFGAGSGETFTIGLQSDEQLTLPTLDLTLGDIGSLIRQDASGAYTANLADPAISSTLAGAIGQASDSLASVGAVQSRLEAAGRVAQTASTNHEAALSVIRDADVARDVTALSRLQILTEGHTAMLAQAREAGAKLISLLSRN